MSKGPYDPDRSSFAGRAALAALALADMRRGGGKGDKSFWTFTRRNRARLFAPATIRLLERRGQVVITGDRVTLAPGATP